MLDYELVNGIEEWVRDYYSSYIDKNKDKLMSISKSVIYRGDFVHILNAEVGSMIVITKGLSSWSFCKEVAYAFSDKHAENFEDEEDDVRVVENYIQVVYVLNGNKNIIDLESLIDTEGLDSDTIDIIKDEKEAILILDADMEYTVVKKDIIDNITYLYLSNNK